MSIGVVLSTYEAAGLAPPTSKHPSWPSLQDASARARHNALSHSDRRLVVGCDAK